MNKIYNIGLLGYGTIGKGVCQIIDNLSHSYNINLVSIFDRPDKKDQIKNKYVSSANDIFDNSNIDIVVEVLGGEDFAYSCIKKALTNHKHVVTANKEVISNHLEELLELAHQNNVMLLFEASCGGGIPLIYPIIQETKFDKITHIYGILNGTSNFILTKMQDEGMNFEEALKLAQKFGFAEKDATSDLEGLDMIRKISILSSLAYHAIISNDKISHYGISNITPNIIDDIKKRNYCLKFVAESYLKNNDVFIGVEPVLMKQSELLANVKNEFNAIILDCQTNGKLMFYGKGAGSLPTATAIGSDIVKIIDGEGFIGNIGENNYKIHGLDENEYEYYTVAEDGMHIGANTPSDTRKILFRARIAQENI